jgi:hypothetical protein
VSDYADEADRFFANPNAFLQSRYAVNTSSSHSPPSHFVFYDVLLLSLYAITNILSNTRFLDASSNVTLVCAFLSHTKSVGTSRSICSALLSIEDTITKFRTIKTKDTTPSA